MNIGPMANQNIGLEKHIECNLISLADEYLKLAHTIKELFDDRIWFLTESAMSVVASLLLKDLANPVALIFVDGPSSGKTTVIDFFEGFQPTIRIDNFTPASFLTQSANVKKSDLERVDLLPKIIYKTLLTPELGTIFNLPRETLLPLWGIIARVLDGSGLTNSGGVHGLRSQIGDFVFGWIGATTPIPRSAWNIMGKVGSRLLFLNAPSRLSTEQRRQQSREIMLCKKHYRTKRKEAKMAVQSHLRMVFDHYKRTDYIPPDEAPPNLSTSTAILDHCGYQPRSVTWDTGQDAPVAIDGIAIIAELVTRGRQNVSEDSKYSDIGGPTTVQEGVDRLTAVLYNLARGHALICGRTKLIADDLKIVIPIGLSSMPHDRKCALELLIDPSISHKHTIAGMFRISELCKALSCEREKANKVMRELKIIGLGSIKSSSGPGESEFSLNRDYDSLLAANFQRYYRSWVPKR